MTATTTEPREITAEEYDITEDGKPTYPTYGIKGGKFYFIGYLPRN